MGLGLGTEVGKGKHELVPETTSLGRGGGGVGGRGWQRQNELVANTTSFLPGAAAGRGGGGVGGRGGQRQKRISVSTNSILPGGRVGKGGYRGHFGSRYTLRLDKNVVKNLSLP